MPEERLVLSRRACAVIGSPIDHSLSPALHAAAYRDLGLDWIYGRHEVPAGALASFVDEIERHGLDSLPCGGLSVTMPGKAEALARATSADPRAAALGAANTLVPSYDGGQVTGWTAYNTDVDGIVGALGDHQLTAVSAKRCVIIGAGGTASAAVAALSGLGARSVEVVARNHHRAHRAVRTGEALGCEVVLREWSALGQLCEEGDVLISTVPPGVADAASSAPFRPGQVILDAVYAGGRTAMLNAAAAAGATAIGGVQMLLHQAVEQVRLMTGRTASVDAMRGALR